MFSEHHNRKSYSLKAGILKLLENKCTDDVLEDVITQLSKLLISMIKGGRSSILKKTGYTPKDVAYIALATLFVKDQNGRFPSLEKIFSEKGELFCLSDESFYQSLIPILIRRLKETLYSLIMESRPEWEKLRVSFMNAVRNSKEFYLVKGKEDHLLLGREILEHINNTPVSYEVITRICYSYRLFYKGPFQFIRSLAKALRKEGINAPIGLKDIVSAFMEINSFPETPVQNNPFLEKIESEAMEEKIKKILDEIRKENNELIEKYVKKHKLLPSEKECFLNALNEIMSDWVQGSNTRSFFDYLKSCIANLDKSIYRKEKRKILEYIVRKSKKKLTERVKELISAK